MSPAVVGAGRFAVGDVVFDSYANPAVVIRIDAVGRPTDVMQTSGSDRGRIGSPTVLRGWAGPKRLDAGDPRIDSARAIVREECRRRRFTWDARGYRRPGDTTPPASWPPRRRPEFG